MSRKLTIGMSTFEDFEGCKYSIQNIRMAHPEVRDEIEFLILDNSPNSPDGERLRNFSKWVKEPIRVLPFTITRGTATRTWLFDMAETPYVLCMDSHVFLEPGSLRKLINGFETGRDQGHLLQGPLLYDSLKVGATHMAHVWRGGMLGIWATAWRCKCGQVFQTHQVPKEDGNWLEIQTMNIPHRSLTNCPGCGFAFPADLRWEGHENALEGSGMRPAASVEEPFEIPAHGLGLFACRKDVWPGFNQRFQDFGGEECYIHEKFRQMGKTTLCLPFLRWWHNFRDHLEAIPYPTPWDSRIMNYLIGHAELGMDLIPVLHHFSEVTGQDIVVEWDGEKPLSVELRDRS